MFIEAIVLGLLLAYLFKTRISNLAQLHIKLSALVLIAVVIQIILFVIVGKQVSGNLYKYLYLVMSALTLIILFVNIRLRGFAIIFLGTIFNANAFFMNGYKMPVRIIESMSDVPFFKSVINGELANYVPIDKITNFSEYFGKVIILPEWYPLYKAISPGDLIISLGVFIFILGESMRARYGKDSIYLSKHYK